jgi:hypothetical protein
MMQHATGRRSKTTKAARGRSKKQKSRQKKIENRKPKKTWGKRQKNKKVLSMN